MNDCEPPDTCITASVLPWVGRTEPVDSGIQSICVFMIPVMAPCRSGEHQTIPSDQAASSRSAWTFGCVSGASSGSGRPDGLKILTSAPSASSRRAASKLSRRL